MGRNYIVESDFVYEGHRCVVIFGDNGYRCGYVGVGEDSPLYGMEATDSVEVDMSEFRNEPLGHRGIMSVLALVFREEEDKIPLHAYFNVHGSITYAGGSLMYPVKSLLWWFGFDCGHAGDGIDLEVVKKNWGAYTSRHAYHKHSRIMQPLSRSSREKQRILRRRVHQSC